MEQENFQKNCQKSPKRLENVYAALNSQGVVGHKKEFADKTGINYSNLSKQFGTDHYTLKTVNKICKRFPQVSRDYLLTGEGTPLVNASYGTMIINGENNNQSINTAESELVLKALQVAERAQAITEQTNENLTIALQLLKTKKDTNQ